MRFLSCKIHCPFICFCKPPPHIYTPGPLKLDNAPQLPSTLVSVPHAPDQLSAETTGVKDESIDEKKQQQAANCPKSNLKRSVREPKEVRNKQVQWMDFLGKELVEIREFESSDIDDMDREGVGNKGCVCVIL